MFPLRDIGISIESFRKWHVPRANWPISDISVGSVMKKVCRHVEKYWIY